MKICNICKVPKEPLEFHKKADNRDGLFNYCIECFKVKQKAYYELNREKILARTAKYDEKNKEAKKAYRESNKEFLKAKSKKYYWESTDRRKYINARRGDLKARKKYPVCTCCLKKDLIQFYANRPDNWQVDHIVCAKLGGKHCLKNVQYLSEADHISKGYEERKLFQKNLTTG